LDQNVEQTAPADSADSVDAKLDRFFEPEQPEVQQATTEQGVEQAVEQTTEAVTETQPTLEEVEYEGARYQLPPELKSALMRQQDYTRKTQEVSERERMVALKQQQQQLEQAFHQSVSPENQALAELDAAIKQYNQVNWQALDTDSLVKTRHALDMLKERRSEVEKQVEQKRTKFNEDYVRLNQETVKKANEYLSRHIPKWGAEAMKEIMEHGQTEGYTDVELSSIRDPRLIKTLWKAGQWDKLQAAKPLAQKRTTGVPPIVKPGSTKPVASLEAQKAETVKQLHQAKDPSRKKDLFDKALDLKLSRMFK
jgi:hypothetical protein